MFTEICCVVPSKIDAQPLRRTEQAKMIALERANPPTPPTASPITGNATMMADGLRLHAVR
ncbi:MAG: hypothetical protein J0J01_09045 [Reyranella sp.]|uniref:hypothetical protein n=1 Tax=Reyranella sp. TaxID=1929291 RepID=UPI001AC8C45F|nr:hypothetical protein [Reyranella sp.]MBN9087040.1 hypothetical protein [Reyranella sp.]